MQPGGLLFRPPGPNGISNAWKRRRPDSKRGGWPHCNSLTTPLPLDYLAVAAFTSATNSRRSTLPTLLFGRLSRNTMCFGTLYAASRSRV